MNQEVREFIRSLQAEGLLDVTLLQLGPHDGLVFRVSGCLSPKAVERLRGQLETWTVKVFGRNVPCLILEDGAAVEVQTTDEQSEDVPTQKHWLGPFGVCAYCGKSWPCADYEVLRADEPTPMMQRAEQEGIR